MLVPQYWAEGRAQARQPNRQVTVRRFGWSDTSQADAQATADARAQEALRRVLAGERLPPRDPRVPYNGADGLPIREEIVSRHGPTVITRNSYGARCLNTPNVLFADVDFPDASTLPCGCVLVLGALVIASVVAWRAEAEAWAILLAVLALLAMLFATRSDRAWRYPNDVARARIARFAAARPDWGFRVYRTPAGLRILVTHQPFEPDGPAVRDLFKALGVDPLYAKMCFNQQCFRARVSPKPWRIGIGHHLRPRPGVWPVHPDRLPMRNEWIATYEAAATGFAACEFIETVGSGIVHNEIAPVVKLHDDLCRATSGLPIA
jgi:hypothetical protein